MKEFVISKETTERTILVALVTRDQSEAKTQEYLDELAFLADTAGAEVVEVLPRSSTTQIPAHLWGRANWPKSKNMSRKTT